MAGYHTGIDYRAPTGTKIHATRGGIVVHSGWNGSYGPAYGMHVVVRSIVGGRSVEHLYAHLSAVKVRNGQVIKAGNVVGLSGETGNTFGAHLHYEERYFPYNYWAHREPVFPEWQPKNRSALKKILERIGRRKR